MNQLQTHLNMSSNGCQMVQLKLHVLKVQINCEGCKRKVKNVLKKIEGVYQVNIDMEEDMVTVSGNLDCATLIKKLKKYGKHAEVMHSENSYGQLNTWFKDDNKLDLGFNASIGQNTLSPILENEYGQLGFNNYSNMGTNFNRGLPNHHNYGAAMNWGHGAVPERGIIRGSTNSITGLDDLKDLTSNFSGLEDEGFSGQKPTYEGYPHPFMMGNNLHNYHYDNSIALPVSYFNNMHNTHNLMKHNESIYMPTHQRMVDPIIDQWSPFLLGDKEEL